MILLKQQVDSFLPKARPKACACFLDREITCLSWTKMVPRGQVAPDQSSKRLKRQPRRKRRVTQVFNSGLTWGEIHF